MKFNSKSEVATACAKTIHSNLQHLKPKRYRKLMRKVTKESASIETIWLAIKPHKKHFKSKRQYKKLRRDVKEFYCYEKKCRRSTRVRTRPLSYVEEFADDIRRLLLEDIEDEGERLRVLEEDERIENMYGISYSGGIQTC